MAAYAGGVDLVSVLFVAAGAVMFVAAVVGWLLLYAQWRGRRP
jgi:hypothetical protein